MPFRGPFEDHTFRAECAPDVVYSWQTPEKINFKNFLQNPLKDGRYLYTWRTPLSTYGYGPVQIRIKLIKDIPFKWLEKKKGSDFFCPENSVDPTVRVISLIQGPESKRVVLHEYLICSVASIHSWSIETRAAKFETENEWTFIQKKSEEDPQTYDALGFGWGRKRIGRAKGDTSRDPYFLGWYEKTSKWGDGEILKAVRGFDKPAFEISGKVYFAPGIEKNELEHFRMRPTYFTMTEQQWREIEKNRDQE